MDFEVGGTGGGEDLVGGGGEGKDVGWVGCGGGLSVKVEEEGGLGVLTVVDCVGGEVLFGLGWG